MRCHFFNVCFYLRNAFFLRQIMYGFCTLPKPVPCDGEVSEFKFFNLTTGKEDLFNNTEDWKPNCFAISLDFAIRMGCFTAKEIPDAGKWQKLMNNDHYFK